MNEIVIIDDLLTPQDCEEFITFFETNRNNNNAHPWLNSLNVAINIKHPYLSMMLQDVVSNAQQLCPGIEFDWGGIALRGPGAFQGAHRDVTIDGKRPMLTSITYLNDNYSGGQTYFENGTQVLPKIGRTVFFDGIHHMHGVSEILKSNRFTLAIWYKQCAHSSVG